MTPRQCCVYEGDGMPCSAVSISKWEVTQTGYKGKLMSCVRALVENTFFE